MYKELLDESEAAKKINLKLKENADSITSLNAQMKTKQEILAITKRKIESFEYVITLSVKYFICKDKDTLSANWYFLDSISDIFL